VAQVRRLGPKVGLLLLLQGVRNHCSNLILHGNNDVRLGGRGRERQVQESDGNHGEMTRSRCDLALCSPDHRERKPVLCPSLLSCDTGWELASGNAATNGIYNVQYTLSAFTAWSVSQDRGRISRLL